MEKERRTKALLLSTLVVVVATLSIAFAAMSRVLNINGTAKMDTASWSVYFDNLSNAKITRGAEEIGKPNISATDNGIIENINVKLSNPKDEISYTVDIVNDGTIDAEITMIKDIELTEVQKKVFEFSVYYTETGEKVSDGDTLLADSSKNITIKIRFKDDITEYDLPTENQVINLSYQITYTQYDGGGEIVGPNGGGTTEKAVLARGLTMEELEEMDDPTITTFFNGPISRSDVESIDFLNSNIVPSEYASTSWDASLNKDETVMAWYEDSDNDELYEVYIGGNGGVYAPSDSTFIFCLFVSLQQINFNNNFDTSDVINMSGMFNGCFELTSVDVSCFDTSNVTTMWGMFGGCSLLESLNLDSFDTTKVIDMSNMFNSCESLTSLDLSSFNTSNVTSMSEMLQDCTSLTYLDFRNADFSSIISYNEMLNDNDSLTIIVKNEEQRTWFTTRFTNLTNVVLPSEL